MRLLRPLSLVIFLSPSALGHQAAQPLTPVRITHIKPFPLTVKIVGPTSKLLKLGPDSEEVVLLTPGTYYCLYHFGDPYGETFTKSSAFIVKPWDGNVWNIKEVGASDLESSGDSSDVYRTAAVLRSSAAEFQSAQVKSPGPSANDAGRRINDLTAIVKLDKMYYANTPAQIRQQKQLVFGYVNRYVLNSLVPKLRGRGLKVNYLGLREGAPAPATGPLLVVACTEGEGDRYAEDPDQPEAGVFGVWISCELAVTHPKFEENPVWKARATGDNALFVSGKSRSARHALHVNALEKLGESFKAVVVDMVDWMPAAATPPQSNQKP